MLRNESVLAASICANASAMKRRGQSGTYTAPRGAIMIPKIAILNEGICSQLPGAPVHALNGSENRHQLARGNPVGWTLRPTEPPRWDQRWVGMTHPVALERNGVELSHINP